MGQLTNGGKWEKPQETRYWILLSRFGKYVEGKFREPRHILGKGGVNWENGKFAIELDGLKPIALYIWIYQLIDCDVNDEENCANKEINEVFYYKIF